MVFFIKLILGASLPWTEFSSDALPAWRLILTGLSILLLRRLPIILLLYRYIPPLYTLHDAALVGWFGPVGVGALWYMSAAALALPDNTTLVPTIMFVVFLSVIAFGITVPFVHMTILTINTMSRSRSVEVPHWPENTPISSSMISGPSVIPLTRMTSNLSYSGNRLNSVSQPEITDSQTALTTSATHLVVPKQSEAENNASNSDLDSDAVNDEKVISTKSSVIFRIDGEN